MNPRYNIGRVSLVLDSKGFKRMFQVEFRFKKKKTEVGGLIAGLCSWCPSLFPHSYLL